MMKNTQRAFTPKPILNWLNEGEYKFNKKMSLQGWAWEFLRRNPLYQADYASLRATMDDAAAKGVDEDEYKRVYNPPRLEGETEDEWIIRFNGACSSSPISSSYAKEWKLAGGFLPDPFKEYSEQWYLVSFITSPRATTITRHWKGFESTCATGSILDNVQQAMAFDLSMPIEPQIDEAYAVLIHQQKRLIGKGLVEEWPRKNVTRQSYPLYLRLLDAELSNATPDEMAVAIKGKNKKAECGEYDPTGTIKKSLAAAQKIRDYDYWAIPMLRKKQRKEFS